MPMWLLGGIFTAVGVPMVWLAQRVFDKDRAIARWPRAPGVVTTSRLKSWNQKVRDRNGLYYDQTVYAPVVGYTYTVDGQVLEGEVIARSVEGVAMGQSGAQRVIDRYPEQKQVMVLYNPIDPKNAYLEVRRSTGAVILLLFGCLWFAIGTLLVVLSFL